MLMVSVSYTHLVVEQLCDKTGGYGIMLTAESDYDFNYHTEKDNPYKKKVREIVKEENIKYFLDVHGLKDGNLYDVAIYYPTRFSKSMEFARSLRKSIAKGVLRKTNIMIFRFLDNEQETLGKFVASQLRVPSVQMCIRDRDVKDKIKQVTSRDYINPEDKTVDFVILFIPNEMIFSYIYDKMPEVAQDAMASKVVFAGPFSFTALLRMIMQAYENFRVQENIYNIIGHVKSFEKEFLKFSEEFYRIGDRIGSLQKQYDSVSTTRFNQLEKSVDRVKQEGIESKEKAPTLLDM